MLIAPIPGHCILVIFKNEVSAARHAHGGLILTN